MSCQDFLEFQDIIKKMRLLDDKIVYALNNSIPTESFKGKVDATRSCKELYELINKEHSEREQAIKNCILITADNVKKLKTEKDSNPNDIDILKHFKTEQSKLRMLQTELSVEEVIQEKTSKLFSEKCRHFFKP